MKIVIFLIASAFLTATVYGQFDRDKVQQTAEMIVAAYNVKDYARIEKQFNAQMSRAITTDKFKEFIDRTHTALGKITKIQSPKIIDQTVGIFPTEFERGTMELMVALDAEQKIAGFSIAPPQQPKPKNTKRNQTKLALPFKGEWFIAWGGDTLEQNQHQKVSNQRFAFDILKVDANGKTYRGDGTKNEDYYAFGQEIVAPADGVVAYAVDGIHDNVPGEMNRVFVPGNLVVVKHADGEYSLFAHFKQNSIRVKVGDKVTKGQTIGLCGNSGNSSEAHLHFQFQDAPFFADEVSMKIFFEKLNLKRASNMETKNEYSPVKGDVVSN